jgi:Mn2+/Fe2+ NRAMP family transporter
VATISLRQRAASPLSYLRAIGPGMVSGAADTDPTTVATLVVIGATTGYNLAWLALLTFPVLAIVQALATRVGTISRRDLQHAVSDGYGMLASALLLVSIVLVNIVTVAADLEAGAAALSLLTGLSWLWFVVPLTGLVVVLLLIGKYDEIERVLKYVLLCLLAYGVAAVLAHPHWSAVARGSLVPSLRPDSDHISGALALLGTTLTAYMYVWQTVEQIEQPPERSGLSQRQVDAVAGSALAAALFWFILVASGATLGVGHEHVDTAAQAAEALRPVAGQLASVLFAIGLLTSALIALPVIMATTAYVTASAFHWRRGLSLSGRQAPAFYAVLTVGAFLGAGLAMAGINPIHLLFIASVIAGVATPVGLVMLVLVAGDARLMNHRPASRRLLTAGWVVAALVTSFSLLYLAKQLNLIG